MPRAAARGSPRHSGGRAPRDAGAIACAFESILETISAPAQANMVNFYRSVCRARLNAASCGVIAGPTPRSAGGRRPRRRTTCARNRAAEDDVMSPPSMLRRMAACQRRSGQLQRRPPRPAALSTSRSASSGCHRLCPASARFVIGTSLQPLMDRGSIESPIVGLAAFTSSWSMTWSSCWHRAVRALSDREVVLVYTRACRSDGWRGKNFGPGCRGRRRGAADRLRRPRRGRGGGVERGDRVRLPELGAISATG